MWYLKFEGMQEGIRERIREGLRGHMRGPVPPEVGSVLKPGLLDDGSQGQRIESSIHHQLRGRFQPC